MGGQGTPPAGVHDDRKVRKEGWQCIQVPQGEYRQERRLSFYTNITA